MKWMKLMFAIAALDICLTVNGQEVVKIVVNPSITASEISRDDLNRIFLMDKTSLPGASHVEPVLERPGQLHEAFLREYVGRTDAALMTYYRSLMFAGRALIPKTFHSESQVLEYVARTKGAIGYVTNVPNTAGVKILKVTE